MPRGTEDLGPRGRAALRYSRQYGWAVFPLQGKRPFAGTHGHKDATTDRKQIRKWWRHWPEANIGVRCDSLHGPIVLDIDGPEAESLVRCLDLPETVEAQSGKKGRHLYFRPDGEPVGRSIKVRKELDVLGDGGYVVVAPSVHPETNRQYRWVRHPKDHPLAPFPKALRTLLDDRETRGAQRDADEDDALVVEGGRNDFLTSLAGSMRRKGLTEEEILDALSVENRKKCSPPLSGQEVGTIARSIAKKPVGDGGAVVLVSRMVGEITPKRIEWFWYPFIPLGELTLLEGDPGVGKSTLWVEIVRGLLTGEGLPYGEVLPSSLSPKDQEWLAGGPDRFVLTRSLILEPRVLILSAEDDAGKMLRPKLEVAGIPQECLNRQVKVIDGVTSVDGTLVGFNLEDKQHVEALEREVARFKATLVIMDPLSSHIGGKSDTHNETKVRALVDPLSRIAQRHDCAVLAIRHLTKSARDKSIYRGQGSIAFAASARSMLLVGLNPATDPDRTFGMVHHKSSYGEPGPGLGFRLVPVAVPELGFDQARSRVAWIGVDRRLTADSMLAQPADQNETPIDEAKSFLRDFLGSGPQEAKSVRREARTEGISDATLRRAKKELGVRSHRPDTRDRGGRFKEGMAWFWSLPA